MARKRVKKDFQQTIRTAHQFDNQTLEVVIAEEIGVEGGEAVGEEDFAVAETELKTSKIFYFNRLPFQVC